jgi:hypothetical protein
MPVPRTLHVYMMQGRLARTGPIRRWWLTRTLALLLRLDRRDR